MLTLLVGVIEQLPSPLTHCSCDDGVVTVVRDGDVEHELGDDEGDVRLSLDNTDFLMDLINLRQASQAYIPYFRDC